MRILELVWEAVGDVWPWLKRVILTSALLVAAAVSLWHPGAVGAVFGWFVVQEVRHVEPTIRSLLDEVPRRASGSGH